MFLFAGVQRIGSNATVATAAVGNSQTAQRRETSAVLRTLPLSTFSVGDGGAAGVDTSGPGLSAFATNSSSVATDIVSSHGAHLRLVAPSGLTASVPGSLMILFYDNL